MCRSMTAPGVPVTRSASVGLVTFPKTAHAHEMHGEAGPTPWDAACQRTHCRRARVILLLTRASWIMGCWQQRIIVLAPPTLTAQVVVQEDRACATGSASVGNPFRERCGSRTRKVQEDLFGIGGQACDVRRQPHRARDRQVAQQSHSEQRHGRQLDGFLRRLLVSEAWCSWCSAAQEISGGVVGRGKDRDRMQRQAVQGGRRVGVSVCVQAR